MMNWQAQEIFKEAKEVVCDEGVFSADQITTLQAMIEKIERAVLYNPLGTPEEMI